MKKFFSVALLAVLLVACSKEKMDEQASQLKTSTTVTSESALKSAVSAAKAGDVITISGTINLTSTLQLLNSGTSSSKISLTGGTLNCASASGWGVKVNGSYWNITNIHITKAKTCGIVFQSGGSNYVNNLTADYCGDDGILVYNGAHDVSVNNSKSNENHDVATQGQNADGVGAKLSGGKNIKFSYVSVNHNSDDGFDLYGQQYTVVMDHCTATKNGFDVQGNGNGFKLGSS